MPTSALTAKGQTTIPKKVRDYLRLKTGDRIEFVLEGEGRVLLRPAHGDIRDLDGLLDRFGRSAASAADMNAAVEREASRPFEAS